MWKIFGFVFEAFIVGYAIWLIFKPAPELRDVVWLCSITLINSIINQGKLEKIEKRLNG